MKKLKLYIETSVWNFLFADDAPEKKRDTIRFFEEIQSGDYELFVSEMVMIEIRRAPETAKNKLLAKISEFEPEELEVTPEIRRLAAKYAGGGLFNREAL